RPSRAPFSVLKDRQLPVHACSHPCLERTGRTLLGRLPLPPRLLEQAFGKQGKREERSDRSGPQSYRERDNPHKMWVRSPVPRSRHRGDGCFLGGYPWIESDGTCCSPPGTQRDIGFGR